jgi:hypothetical protein
MTLPKLQVVQHVLCVVVLPVLSGVKVAYRRLAWDALLAWQPTDHSHGWDARLRTSRILAAGLPGTPSTS